MHFGTFQLTAEAIDAPLRDLATARVAAGVAERRFVALDIIASRRSRRGDPTSFIDTQRGVGWSALPRPTVTIVMTDVSCHIM